MRPIRIILLRLSLLAGLLVHAGQAQAQQFIDQQSPGPARLKVAAAVNGLQIDFRSPLIRLLGFDYSPGNEQQEPAYQAMLARMQQARLLFVATAEARCRVDSVSVQAPAEPETAEVGEPAAVDAAGNQYPELHAVIAYRCADPAALHSLDIQLFKAFPGIKTLDAVLMTDAGQLPVQLTPQAHLLSW